MVIAHVKDHLDPGRVEAAHHRLKLPHRVLAHVTRFRREKADGLVAPVIAQSALHKEAVVKMGVDRQQFDRSDAKAGQVIQHRLAGKAKVGAAQAGINAGMGGGQAFDMRLVDHRAVERVVGVAVCAPVIGGIHHHRFRHGEGAVAGVERQIGARAAKAVAHHGVRPFQPPVKLLGIGVDQQLVGVEAVARLWLVGAMRAKAVAGAGGQALHIHMPDVAVAVAKRQAGEFLATVVRKQAKLDLAGIGGKDGEVDALTVKTGPHRPRAPLRHRMVAQMRGQRPGRGVHGIRLS
ncbi:hypothetical protein GALL_535890 [mine drainage metagenome]|uniref:Uncharacterized protein n=1 Tax=mine drainage metagenome TaxID=410659 RepID=A0A1J5P1B7_9ZZZZ